jgi:hypothetical protein
MHEHGFSFDSDLYKNMVVTVVCNPWEDAFSSPTCKVDVSCLFL